MKKLIIVIGILAGICSIQTQAKTETLWQLSTTESKVAYGSIKKNTVGEVNHFKSIEGVITKQGQINISIDVTSVETYIDIRNQRMLKHVFDATVPKATLTSTIDLQTVEQLSPGDTGILEVSGTLNLSGKTVEVETTMFIARLTDNRFLATTDEMLMIKTADLGINAGVDKLRELAQLDSITRVVPVSLRMIFEREISSTASIAPPQAKPLSLNLSTREAIQAGKQIYRQCQACHQAKDPVNGAGPHLVNIIGRKAGSLNDYSYSKAIKASDIIWTNDILAEFLSNPQLSIPGNKMPFGGIGNPKDVQNLISYLESISESDQ